MGENSDQDPTGDDARIPPKSAHGADSINRGPASFKIVDRVRFSLEQGKDPVNRGAAEHSDPGQAGKMPASGAAADDLWGESPFPRSLAPLIMPDPPVEARAGSAIGTGITVFVIAMTAAAVIFFVHSRPQSSLREITTGNMVRPPVVGSGTSTTKQVVAAAQPTPNNHLIIASPSPGPAGGPLPLGVYVRDPDDGAIVVIQGVPAGSKLSSGQMVSPGIWQLQAAEIKGATIHPPQHFSGIMNLTMELRFADGRVLEKRSLDLNWTSPAVSERPAAFSSDDAALPATGASAAYQPNRREIENFVARSEQFMRAGDVVTARLFLQHAVDAQDPRAALALGASYDPDVLDKLGIEGRVTNLAQMHLADITMARLWYEKAEAWGSVEASRRLELLNRLR